MGNTPDKMAPYQDEALKSTGYETFKGAASERNATAEIHFAPQGVASKEANLTVSMLFKQAVDTKGNQVCLRTERPCPKLEGKQAGPAVPLNEWKSWTIAEYYAEVAMTARAFMALGLGPKDAVAIYGFNAPEWLFSEVGAIHAGGIAAGIYPTDTPTQVEYKAKHSGTVVACVETVEKAQIFLKSAAAKNLPKLRAVVVWDPETAEADCSSLSTKDIQVLHWVNLVNAAAQVSEAELEARVSEQKPTECCAYIYTSGTTGSPKAVMISHDNIIFESRSAMQSIGPCCFNKPCEERVISYLPLSHVAGMMVDIILPLVAAAETPSWVSSNFARSYDLKASTIVQRFGVVKPTLFIGVPRVWEKIQAKMMQIKAAAIEKGEMSAFALMVSEWGKKVSLEAALDNQIGGGGKKDIFYGLAEALVQKKVKTALGLDQCKFAFTGAAPIAVDTLEYFASVGIDINEVYGMSECTGAATWSNDKAHVWGSVGWAVPGVEVKVLDSNNKEVPHAAELFQPTEEEQGEVCYRGRNIMMGYLANPDLGAAHVAEIAKKNAEAIDSEGWLHSGDKGCRDSRGLFRITGRYKELLIGAGGENIAPVPIEDSIKKLAPCLSNVMMVGDKKPFNCIVVTLKTKGATGDLPGTQDLDLEALKLAKGVTTVPEAMASSEFIEAITQAINDTNNNEAVCPMNASKVQKFTILPTDFSVSTDELTPTFKLKRSFVADKYAKAIEAMYKSKDTYVPFKD